MKYPTSELVKRHRNNKVCSCLWFSGSGFSWLGMFCISPFLKSWFAFWFVLFGERFYEGLISILDSGVCLGPVV